MMVADNLHLDIDRHEPGTVYISVWIVCALLVDSIEDVHLLARIHRPSRTQDAPFCERVQLFPYKLGINQSPKMKKEEGQP